MSAMPDLSEGACFGLETDLFYPEPRIQDQEQLAVVKKICRSCPVQQACLDWALQYEQYGIWGGTSENERRRMRAAGPRKRNGWVIVA